MNHATDGNLSAINDLLGSQEESDIWESMTKAERAQYICDNIDEPDHERSE
jgi:hypothetical protein